MFDVVHCPSQRVHFTHLLVLLAAGDVFSQSLEPEIDQLHPVPLALVPPVHGCRLGLGQVVTQLTEVDPSLAPQRLGFATRTDFLEGPQRLDLLCDCGGFEEEAGPGEDQLVGVRDRQRLHRHACSHW